MAKSLSEQIAAIANKPAVEDYDVEDSERNVFEHRDDSGEGSEDDSEDEKLAKSHYVNVGKSQLRNEGIALRDEKYGGAKGSRDDMYANATEDVESEQEEGESFGEEDSEQDEELEKDEDESDSGVSMRTDSEDEAEEKEQDILEDDEDVEVKRQRLAEMVQKEARSAASKLSETTHRDAVKGFAVLEQYRTFDHILDTRIKLQKAVNAANQLPLSTSSWDQSLQESSKNEKHLSKTMKLLEKVMGQLVDFRQDFQVADKINQVTDDSKMSYGQKRSFSQLCDETADLNMQLKSYRNVVLNKWSTKISSASGKSVMSSSKFKAIHQPADVQVEHQLADIARLLKRTRLNRRNVVSLGFKEDLEQGALEELRPLTNTEPDQSDNEDIDVPKDYDPRKKDNKNIDTSENPYVFDDEDFYRVLLNDLVDKKIAGAQGENSGATIAITSRSNNKLKKNVDTKASKGRKLNFTIQEAIANYEAPVNGGFKWSDEQIDEFCSGLLGQRINFDEEYKSEDEGHGAQESVDTTGIQIFG
ncbi:LANO_0H10792g1_1 [Lachancea nothofagi CBS 11611]|uniref:Protein BFR2 n=1 Tax=Lachancea nothofagi CBS 11611 TaxID=1266666 RepID=A0A1G4KME3_9SACH|nr:LANO_0H10792g1_1 [Lachancea nothofagi CBS 11611]